MTENEVIEILESPSKHIKMVHKAKNEMQFYAYSADLVKAFEIAIQALQEVQEYRQLGTVRQVQDFIADWRKYKELGSLEEIAYAKRRVHMAELAIDSIENEKETIRSKTIDEVINRILPYGSFCVEWNEGMTKEEIAESVINQAKEQFIDTLEGMRGARNE